MFAARGALSAVRLVLAALAVVMLHVNLAAAAPCPTGRALAALVRTTFPDATATAHPRCVDVRAAVPLWLVTADVTAAHDGDGEYLGLEAHALIADGQVVAGGGLQSQCTPCMSSTWVAVDLDGDGRDEIVAQTHKVGHMATSADWIEIHALADDGAFVDDAKTGGYVWTGESSSYDHYACSATHAFERRADGTTVIRLDWTIRGTPLPPGCPSGRHRFAWSSRTSLDEIPH